MRDDNISHRPHPGQQNGQQKNNRSAHANTATTPTSTTKMKAYVPEKHAPSTTAAATTAATSTSIATLSCTSSLPDGIGYSFFAAPPINIGTRAFVHVEGYTTKLQAKAWEGVIVIYDSDKPTFHMYDRYTGRISSSRNVSFIEEPPTVLQTAESGGQEAEVPDGDLESGSDFVVSHR